MLERNINLLDKASTHPVFKLNNGAIIPAVGLGTWNAEKGQVGEVVKLALELGYRHLDCAYAYGNEAEIGQALAEVFAKGKIKREDLFITSKLWCDSHLPEHVLPACQETLNNLQLDCLDLYLIHIPIAFKKGSKLVPNCIADGVVGYDPQNMQKTWKAMEELVTKGLCKAIGVSNFTTKKLINLLETAVIVPACNQVELHPYLPQPGLQKFCDSKGIVLTAYAPLGSPARPFDNIESEPIVLEEPVLHEVAKKNNCSVAKIALRWGLQRGFPILPKASSRGHLEENLNVLNMELSDEDMAAINSIKTRYRFLKQNWMYKPEEDPGDIWDGEQ